MADLLAIEHVNNFFVLRNCLLRAAPEAFCSEFVASPELVVVDGLKDAQEFRLPFLALVEEVHVSLTYYCLCGAV